MKTKRFLALAFVFLARVPQVARVFGRWLSPRRRMSVSPLAPLDQQFARAVGPAPAKATRILVVAAHPDDEVIGCGGLISHFSMTPGLQVFVLLIAAEKPERRLESIDACSALGLTKERVIFADLPDGQLEQHIEGVRHILREAAANLRPALIITHRLDAHPDHRAVAAAVEDVFGHVCGTSILHFKIPQHRSTPWGPNAYVRITALDARRKLAALGSFRTQFGKSYLNSLIQLAALVEGGHSAGSDFAEAFEAGPLWFSADSLCCVPLMGFSRKTADVGKTSHSGPRLKSLAPVRVVLERCPYCSALCLARPTEAP